MLSLESSKATTIKKVGSLRQVLWLSVVTRYHQYTRPFMAIIMKIFGEITRRFLELPRKIAENFFSKIYKNIE